MPSDQTPWVVKGVPEHIRRTVKSYAVNHDMTMADALQMLVLRGLAVGITTSRDPALGVLRDFPDKVLAAHVQRVVEEIAQSCAVPRRASA